jgi:hypothetical protein
MYGGRLALTAQYENSAVKDTERPLYFNGEVLNRTL